VNTAECSICEKDFDPGDLEIVELGKHLPPNFQRTFKACANCAMIEKLNWYKLNYELSREKIEVLKTENNLFRTLMLKVETMSELGSESTISTRSYILQHRPGWEALPIDTLILFLDLYQKHASTFAELLNKKASREEIKTHLEKKTEQAKISDIKKNEAIKKDKSPKVLDDGLTGKYSPDERKAVKSLMKTLKLTEEKAWVMVRQMMGLTVTETNEK
jgi:hypothetical protein